MRKSLLLAAGAAGESGSGVEQRSGADFDGVNDYFGRTTGLVGNTDSKTFTLSCWVYFREFSDFSQIYLSADGSATRFIFSVSSSGELSIIGTNSVGKQLLSLSLGGIIKENTFHHVLVSVDLSDTTKRHVFVNDVSFSPSWKVYSDEKIVFDSNNHYINGVPFSDSFQGRISNLFLDYAYRDLSIEANRRLFTEYDPYRGLAPAADQQALSPIIYLPFDDPTQFGLNLGTGGDFVQNGVLALSNRGAGQYNVAASEFDGSSQSLTGPAAIAPDSKTFTVSVSFMFGGSTLYPIYFDGPSQNIFSMSIDASKVSFSIKDLSASTIYSIDSDEVLAPNTNHTISVSVDVSDALKTRFYLDGEPLPFTSTSGPVDTTIPFSSATNLWSMQQNGFESQGVIGELYFDTSYIDLAANNPFWDSKTNKPKYPGENGELPTGQPPLIYLPLRAVNPGENRGTGGDFTLNGGHLSGARGPSEHWARTMSGESLTAGANSMILHISSSNDALYSGVVAFKYNDDETDAGIFGIGDGSVAGNLGFHVDGSGPVGIRAVYGLLGASGYLGSVGNGWNTVFFSRINSSNMYFYCINQDGTDYETTLNFSAAISAQNVYLGSAEQSTSTTRDFLGFIGGVYVSQTYIDFSREENRLLFVDALGYPVPLQPSIDAGLIPEGLVRMEFEDTANLGANSGTGGDFTVFGTVTPGADVNA